MEPILVTPDPAPPDLTQALDLAGLAWKSDTGEVPLDGWSGAVVWAGPEVGDGTEAVARAKALREGEVRSGPIVVVVAPGQLSALDDADEAIDDFCLTPIRPDEVAARLRKAFRRTGSGSRPELVEHGPLVLNTETYQAVIDGKPLDLTYMEYELLRFLASHPGRVFTREALLSRVWGYDYYGGARTVDVHIRRLRAKLGEEHAGLINTVRSVGYRFGQARW